MNIKKSIYNTLILLCILFFCICSNVNAEINNPEIKSSREERFESRNEAPDSISGQLNLIDQVRKTMTPDALAERIFGPWFNLTDKLYENYGLNLGITYSFLYQHASQSLEGGKKDATGGILDFFGEWYLLNRGKKNEGFLGFKTKWSNSPFTEIPPNRLNEEIGSLWRTSSSFNEQDFFITQVWWQQNLLDDKLRFRIGKVDQSDFIDFFRFSSAKLFFINAAFSLNPTIPYPENGLGGFVKFQPTNIFYVLLSLGDNNAEGDSFNFKSFFEDREYFTALEINFWPLLQKIGLDGNNHITLWHSDGRDEKGIKSSKGLSINLDELLYDRYGVFIRYSYSDGKETNVKQLFSLGFGLSDIMGFSEDIFAVAFAVGEPRQSNLRTQYVIESFYRIQLLNVLQVTPDIQFIVNPSDNPEEDFIVVYGIRFRVAI